MSRPGPLPEVESTAFAAVDGPSRVADHDGDGAADFAEALRRTGHPPPARERVTTLQVNVGLRCNLACHHCHVESGPKRSEALSAAGCARVLELLEVNPQIAVLDLTGGAPELHPGFRDLVRGARALGRRVIDRCNLTVVFEPGQEDTIPFLAEQEVHLIASLPCYTRDNVERQRGRGIFDGSLEALRQLNAAGYARDAARRLDLVYNPVGAFLPPSQVELEAEYRQHLCEDFGIEFDALLTITNMPIKRFARQLEREGRMAEYMSLLVTHFNPHTLPDLMCRRLLSVDHRGRLFDCDFNQALELDPPWGPATLWDVEDLDAIVDAPIRTAGHCFGCTAGAGSSCGGALASPNEPPAA